MLEFPPNGEGLRKMMMDKVNANKKGERIIQGE
jgi:hypothetical protein